MPELALPPDLVDLRARVRTRQGAAHPPATHAPLGDPQRQQVLQQPFLVLTGPTACGKSALALALAHALRPHCPVEIISMDSALVYRGMDIGTAKPSAAELAAVPHHGIDIRAPEHSYSAAEFVHDCTQWLAAILARGALPLVVGGTLLYLHTLLHGLDPLPAADAPLRAELDALARQHSWPVLHTWLALVDPASAQRLAPHDAQRVQRALEVWLLSGQPLSQLQTRQRSPQPGATTSAADGAGDDDAGDDAGNDATDGASDHASAEMAAGGSHWRDGWVAERVLSLEPASRAWLHERTNARLDAMVQAGFLTEVQRLRQNPALHVQLPAIRSVGYRQAWQMLDGEVAESQWLEQAKAATRQLAKRQMTWLRSMPTRQVLHCDQLSNAQILAQALDWARPIVQALPWRQPAQQNTSK